MSGILSNGYSAAVEDEPWISTSLLTSLLADEPGLPISETPNPARKGDGIAEGDKSLGDMGLPACTREIAFAQLEAYKALKQKRPNRESSRLGR